MADLVVVSGSVVGMTVSAQASSEPSPTAETHFVPPSSMPPYVATSCPFPRSAGTHPNQMPFQITSIEAFARSWVLDSVPTSPPGFGSTAVVRSSSSSEPPFRAQRRGRRSG